MRLSRGSYFIFGTRNRAKKLVYFCEVFALQSPSGSDKAEGFEPSKTGKAGLYFSIISVNAKSYNPSIEKRRVTAYNEYGVFYSFTAFLGNLKISKNAVAFFRNASYKDMQEKKFCQSCHVFHSAAY